MMTRVAATEIYQLDITGPVYGAVYALQGLMLAAVKKDPDALTNGAFLKEVETSHKELLRQAGMAAPVVQTSDDGGARRAFHVFPEVVVTMLPRGRAAEVYMIMPVDEKSGDCAPQVGRKLGPGEAARVEARLVCDAADPLGVALTWPKREIELPQEAAPMRPVTVVADATPVLVAA